MKDLYQEVRQIELEKRENVIRDICQRKCKISFSSAMHKLAEKEDSFSFLDQSRQAVECFESPDLASENLAEMFG